MNNIIARCLNKYKKVCEEAHISSGLAAPISA